MLLQDRKKFCMQLCSVADSKRVCGLITNIFTADLSVQESAHFIFDIVSSDNFLDMQGNMANFQEQIRNQVWKVLEPLIASNFSLDCNGDIVESDADSNGNLRYGIFVRTFAVRLILRYLILLEQGFHR